MAACQQKLYSTKNVQKQAHNKVVKKIMPLAKKFGCKVVNLW